MGDAAGARKILETGQSKERKTVQLGDAGVAYVQSVIFRKGRYLVRMFAMSPRPTHRKLCWPWRTAWKRNCN